MVTLTATDRQPAAATSIGGLPVLIPWRQTMRTRTTSSYARTAADIRMTALFAGRPRGRRREGRHPYLEEQPAAVPPGLAGDASR
jgi:hypothetical protein